MKILLQVGLSRKHSAAENSLPTCFPAYLKLEAVVKKKTEVRSRFSFLPVPLLDASRGEFDLDLGTEGATERRMNYEG